MRGGVFRTLVLSILVIVISLQQPMRFTLAQTGDEESSGPSAFVDGSVRFYIYQSALDVDPSQLGLAAQSGKAWAVVVLDVTNFGTVPRTISLTEFSIKSGQDGTAVPGSGTQGASAALGFSEVQPDGTVTIPVDTSVRVAAAFAVPTTDADESAWWLGFGAESTAIRSTIVDALDVASLPAVQPWIGSQSRIQTVPGNGQLEVLVGGAAQTVTMVGTQTPPADGCFGAESSSAVTTLSGGTVWIEDDPLTDEFLVWYWDGGKGHLVLLNATLLEQGLAGVSQSWRDSAYGAWLESKADAAEEAATGLWPICRGAEGEWINPPTPTPVPTKTADEVRAEYEWVDTRDLVIRPHEFKGVKIAVQGTVFNIDVSSDGVTGMQIWLDGGSEAAVIVYEGESRGIYEGTWVTVYGVGAGTFQGTNAFGGTIEQPLIYADIVDF